MVEMNCLGQKIHPSMDNNFVRKNGWSVPFNGLQILSWVLVIYIAFIHFGVLAIAVNRQLWPATFVCVGGLFLLHIVLLILGTTKNPADDNSIQRMKAKNKPLPVFDRSIHAHVIENRYCHICEVSIGPLSKHCIQCNKCVAVFDHHCKWLNNCVGEKNYRIFIGTLISAILGGVGIIILALFVFITVVQDFDNFNSDVWWNDSFQSRVAFVFLIGLCIIFLFIILILVSQLLVFHFMLWRKNITTYEYIKRKTKKKSEQSNAEYGHAGKLEDDRKSPVCNDVSNVADTSAATSLTSNVVKNRIVDANKNGSSYYRQ